MGGKSSQANSSQATNNYDQRQVNTTTIEDNSSSYDLSNRSVNTNTYDLSDRSYTNWQDSSSTSLNSTTTTNLYGADAAAINAQNTAFLRDVNAGQTDGIKAIAAFGTDALNRMGASATDLFSTSSANAVRSFDLATARSTDAWNAAVERGADAWSDTVKQSTSLIDKLLTGATNTVNAARDISQQAITSFQPAENKAQDTSLRLGMIAAAGVAILMLTRKS